ncbi:hypothetical protein NPIL_640741 [Nephila pilipes]|uniref:Uncharacterized protein n=1 Tax=Nephila pilipes TaxID=299642 RepID=A0A8X6TQU3_NEPPI|nr:hypothetical protein NPIL_453301 [Nephila pilipes]GFT92731.1 hypothetical protein NPIL_640741 [Nephila pilipes]
MYFDSDNLLEKRSSGQRLKKKQFQDNKYVKKSKSAFCRIVFENIAPNKSTSAKKLPSTLNVSQSLEKDICHGILDYRLIDINLMFSKLEKYKHCTVYQEEVKMSQKSTVGSTFLKSCKNCEVQQKFNFRELIGDKKMYLKYIGKGLSSLETFCSIMCLPKLADVGEAHANASMKKAVKEEKNY